MDAPHRTEHCFFRIPEKTTKPTDSDQPYYRQNGAFRLWAEELGEERKGWVGQDDRRTTERFRREMERPGGGLFPADRGR